MPKHCAYCGYKSGDTKDHIMPKSITKYIGTNSGNIVPSCKWCNREKSNNIYLPTINNIYGKLKHFNNEQLYEYAIYCYTYGDLLEQFVESYRLEEFKYEYDQFLLIFRNGYFDDLDSHRVPSKGWEV